MGPRVFFLRDATRFPVACIASELISTTHGDVVRFAISVHNPKDTFNRARGRHIAIARLEKRECGHVPAEPKVIKASILQAVADDPTVPIRVREAAKGWLEEKRAQSPTDTP